MSTEKRDIVERIRLVAAAIRGAAPTGDWHAKVCAESAAEITQLRTAVAHERAVNEAALRTCAEAEGAAIALREALQEIYDFDDGAWAAGRHWKAAEKQGRRTMRGIAGEALRKMEEPR